METLVAAAILGISMSFFLITVTNMQRRLHNQAVGMTALAMEAAFAELKQRRIEPGTIKSDLPQGNTLATEIKLLNSREKLYSVTQTVFDHNGVTIEKRKNLLLQK